MQELISLTCSKKKKEKKGRLNYDNLTNCTRKIENQTKIVGQ